MAISSVGGADPTDTGGPRSATGGTESEAVGAFATVTPEEAAASQEAEAARVAALTGGNTTGGATGGNTTEALAGGNTTAGNLTKETTEGNTTRPTTLAEVPEATITALKENLTKAGGIYADPRYTTAALEFETLGAVTAETKEATAKAFGVPVETVDQFIAGQVAQRSLASQQQGQPTQAQIEVGQAVLRVVPDQAAYEALIKWGQDGENVSATEKAAFDAALNRGDAATTEALLRAFHGRYTAAGNGPGPRDITQEGGLANATAAAGYESSAAMQKDMSDPKYAKDPAFRSAVAARVAASNFK